MLNSTDQTEGIFYIRQFGDPILNQAVPEVTDFNGKLDLSVKSMIKFLNPSAIGVAAPQVGIQRRYFVWQIDEQRPKVIINPELIDVGRDKMIIEEGCLSIPGLTAKMIRYKDVVIEGYDLDEKKIQVKGTQLRAALFQHELDHLDGILTINSPYRVG